MFEPLRIELHLCSPINMDSAPVHLDGLLAYAKLQDLLSLGISVDPADEDGPVYKDLPLEHDGDVYKASVFKLVGVRGVETRAFVRKAGSEELIFSRFDPELGPSLTHVDRLSALNTTSGEFKNSRVFIRSRVADMAIAYAIGDREEIARLLKEHVDGLGCNRHKGMGKISRIEVVPDGSAEVAWANRFFPREKAGYIPIEGRFRAPYWKKNNIGIVYAPKTVF